MNKSDPYMQLIIARQKEIEARYKLGLAIFQLTEAIIELSKEYKMETDAKSNTCHLCGHSGNDVTRIMWRHFGGQGELSVPICDDRKACFRRMAEAEEEWRQAMGIKVED